MISDQIDPRLINIFKDLISIEGLSGSERHVFNYIKLFLNNLNLAVEDDYLKIHPKGNSGNLKCKIGNGGNTAFLAHMDTARSTKNVISVVSNDRIQSKDDTVLGVDNRAGIAILLYTIEKIIKNYKRVPDFTVAFTICEETTLFGSDNINLDNIDMAYVFDSALRPGNFISQSYGAKSFKIIVHGKASHSGIAPEKGISAIQIAAKAIDNLNLGKIDDFTTINIGKIDGGESVNVVPAQTIVLGEIRSLIQDNVQTVLKDVKQKFTNAAESFSGKIEMSSFWDFKPYKTNLKSKVYKRLCDAIKKVGLEPNPAISAGGSDANSLNKRGIPTINIGIGAQNPHSNDEFILLEDFQKSAEIALQLIKYNKA
jgi:tripeptide aminopeptidase